MADPSNFVSIAISVQTLSVGSPNFGTILICAESAIPQGQVYTFAPNPDGLAAYVAAGGAVTDPGYLLLSAIAAQSRHVDQVKFYSRSAGGTPQYTLTVLDATEGTVYAFEINNEAIEYEVPNGATTTTVAAALEALIEAVAGVASSATDETITIDPDGVADVAISGTDPELLELQHLHGDSNVNLDLAAAAALDDDFYGVLIDSTGDTDISDAAAWVEANGKALFARTFDEDALDGEGILNTLNAAGYHRTVLLVSGDSDVPANAALMGLEFSKDPGASYIGKKNLAGVTYDKLTSTKYDAITAKNGITYTRTLGVSFTSHGKAVSGRQFHITRNLDWLKARMQQALLQLQVSTDILIYSDEQGIAQNEMVVRAVLAEAERKQVILPGWAVQVTKKADQNPSDVNAGLLRGITWQAEAGKGIEKVFVSGTVN